MFTALGNFNSLSDLTKPVLSQLAPDHLHSTIKVAVSAALEAISEFFQQEPSSTETLKGKEKITIVTHSSIPPMGGSSSESASKKVTAKTAAPSLFQKLLSWINANIVPGATKATATVGIKLVQQFIETSELLNCSEEDKKFFNSLSEKLDKSENPYELFKDLVNRLNRYHIIVAGVHINQRATSSQTPHEGNAVSPIIPLLQCEEKIKNFIEKNKLTPPKEALKSSETLAAPAATKASKPLKESSRAIPSPPTAEQAETDRLIENLCNSIAHTTTMSILDTLFLKSEESAVLYKGLIQKNEQARNIRHDFTERYPKSSRPLIHFLYKTFFSFFSSILHSAAKNFMRDMRSFMGTGEDFLPFIEKTLSQVSHYFGSIELAAHAIAKDPRLGIVPGSFDGFLANELKSFSNGAYTEEMLYENLENYLLDNYLKPDLSIKGIRLPGLTSLSEYALGGIEKAMARSYLKKSSFLKQLIANSTDTVKSTQLSYKTLIVGVLNAALEIVEKHRNAKSSVQDPTKPPTNKTFISSKTLHENAQNFSKKFLKFIEVESCNNSYSQLLDLTGQTIVGQATNTVKDLTLRPAIEASCTQIIEEVLGELAYVEVSVFEKYLQNALKQVNTSYITVASLKEEEKKRHYSTETKACDDSIANLTTRLSSMVIEGALENHLRNHTGERQLLNESLIHKEKEALKAFYESIQKLVQEPSEDSKNVEEQMAQLAYMLQDQLRRMNALLSSSALDDAYTDVRGDLYNMYYSLIKEIDTQILPILDGRMITLNLFKNHEAQVEALERIKVENTQLQQMMEKQSETPLSPFTSLLEDMQRYLPLLNPNIPTDQREEAKYRMEGLILPLISLDGEKDISSQHNQLLLCKVLELIHATCTTEEEYHSLLGHISSYLLPLHPRSRVLHQKNLQFEKFVESIEKKIATIKNQISLFTPPSDLPITKVCFIEEQRAELLAEISSISDFYQNIGLENRALYAHEALIEALEFYDSVVNSQEKRYQLEVQIEDALKSRSPVSMAPKKVSLYNQNYDYSSTAQIEAYKVNVKEKLQQLRELFKEDDYLTEIDAYLSQPAHRDSYHKALGILYCNKIAFSNHPTPFAKAKGIADKIAAIEPVLAEQSDVIKWGIKMLDEEIYNSIQKMSEKSDSLTVAGAMNLGKLPIQRHLEPLIKQVIKNYLENMMKSFFESFGKPLHLKQLLLRTLLVDVAEANQTSS